MFKLLLITLVAIIHNSSACTEFIVEVKGNKGNVVGRTMEFAQNFPFNVISQPAGEVYTGDVTPGCKGKTPLSWTGKYKSAYLASATRLIEDADKLWLDGQNSAGLSVGALYFDGYAQYPSELVGDECTNGISHIQMIKYILSVYGSTNEVREALSNGTFPAVWGRELKVGFIRIGLTQNYIFPIHWSIVDNSGDAIVLEYTKDGRQVYENQVGVFTNNPTYDWHTTNLNSYINIQRDSFEPKTWKRAGTEYTIKSFGHGSGFLGLPGDFTPPSRFIRTAAMVRFSGNAKNAQDAALKAWHIINSVDIPKHAVDDFTNWAVVKDLKNNVMYFRGVNYISIRQIDLNKTSNTEAEYVKLNGKFEDCVQDVTSQMKSYDANIKEELPAEPRDEL
eukprot:TCONS_00004996-protein